MLGSGDDDGGSPLLRLPLLMTLPVSPPLDEPPPLEEPPPARASRPLLPPDVELPGPECVVVVEDAMALAGPPLALRVPPLEELESAPALELLSVTSVRAAPASYVPVVMLTSSSAGKG